MDKDTRSELLRRQRMLRVDLKVKHITRRAATQLNDDPSSKPKFNWSLFKKKIRKNHLLIVLSHFLLMEHCKNHKKKL
jgi:hypothetical protein